jgi:hypothetical protein
MKSVTGIEEDETVSLAKPADLIWQIIFKPSSRCFTVCPDRDLVRAHAKVFDQNGSNDLNIVQGVMHGGHVRLLIIFYSDKNR